MLVPLRRCWSVDDQRPDERLDGLRTWLVGFRLRLDLEETGERATSEKKRENNVAHSATIAPSRRGGQSTNGDICR